VTIHYYILRYHASARSATGRTGRISTSSGSFCSSVSSCPILIRNTVPPSSRGCAVHLAAKKAPSCGVARGEFWDGAIATATASQRF
jgi:hypothetical protein